MSLADSIPVDSSSATLVILAGGIGERMGIPKALVQIDGVPILKWLLNQIAWPGPTMLVTAPAVANPPGWEHFDRNAIDPVDGLGPLRGIQTALENLSTPTLVVIPVDMPVIGRRQLVWLLTALAERPEIQGVMCRPKFTGRIEPFPSSFRAAAKDAIAQRLASGRRSVQELCRDPRFAAVDAPENWPAETWTNLNDPSSLRAFQSSRRGSSSKEKK